MNYQLSRSIVLLSLISFVFWALFIFLGLHSYLVDAPESQSDIEEPCRDFVSSWDAEEGDTALCPTEYYGFDDTLVGYLNWVRDEQNLSMLPVDSVLSAAARCEAQAMFEGGFRGFTTPEDSHLDERLATLVRNRIGASRALWSELSDSGQTVSMAAIDIVRGWVNTANQAKVLGEPHYTRAGAGLIKCEGRLLAVLILFEDMLVLDEDLPLRIPEDSTLVTVGGQSVGRFSPDEIEPTFLKQERGFFTRYAMTPMPVELRWQGNWFEIDLPFDGDGLYLLRVDAGSHFFDTHPMRVE